MNSELLIESKEMFDRAFKDFKPHIRVMMFSGGDDSLTTLHVARELGIRIDFVIHGNTRTGIRETTDFAIKEAEQLNHKLIIADAGNTYEDYVYRKGFFGKGLGAHEFTYHRLKQEHFEKAVSNYIRQRRRGIRILFINGARRKESENRMITMVNPSKVTKRRPNDIWFNLINEWEKHDCLNYLEGNGINRNPVSVNLCRSGECMCGTTQTAGDRAEASFFYPDWGKWLDELERKIIEKHGWGWNDNMPKQKKEAKEDKFQPMCTGCKINYKQTDLFK